MALFQTRNLVGRFKNDFYSSSFIIRIISMDLAHTTDVHMHTHAYTDLDWCKYCHWARGTFCGYILLISSCCCPLLFTTGLQQAPVTEKLWYSLVCLATLLSGVQSRIRCTANTSWRISDVLQSAYWVNVYKNESVNSNKGFAVYFNPQ